MTFVLGVLIIAVQAIALGSEDYCPSASGRWNVQNIIRLKTQGSVIRITCDFINFKDGSKIIAEDHLYLYAKEEMSGHVNIQTNFGRLQGEHNSRTTSKQNKLANREIYLRSKKYNLSRLELDTSGLPGGNGSAGMNGLDQTSSADLPTSGENGFVGGNGQSAGRIFIFIDLQSTTDSIASENVIFGTQVINQLGGAYGQGGTWGLGGMHLNPENGRMSSNTGATATAGQSGANQNLIMRKSVIGVEVLR